MEDINLRNIKHAIRLYIKETDKLLFFLSLVASAFGVLMVYSATRSTLKDGQIIPNDLKTMVIAAAIGVVLCLIISAIDYMLIIKLWPLIGLVCIGLMGITLVWGVAPAARPDAKTWLDLGGFFFQPSELVKIGFIITFAAHLDLVKENISHWLHVLLLGVHAMILVGLVMKSGDDGSAVVFLIIAVGMMFVAGVHWGYFLAGGTLVAVAFPIIWTVKIGGSTLLKQYQKDRILAVIFPELYAETEAYQQNQSVTAIGSGKFWGKGLFEGPFTQNGIVPESKNDMVFSVVGEELGFLGCIALIALLTFIIFRIIKNGKQAKENPAYLICYGMAFMIAGQALLNIGMNIRLFPVIGITLPFFSAGGSANLCIYIGIGLIMSIYRYNQSRDAVNFRLSRLTTPFSEI